MRQKEEDMKRLKFINRMELSFDKPVSGHAYALRCIPRTDSAQKIETLLSRVTPSGISKAVKDGFGNLVYTGSCAVPHTAFGYEIKGTALVDQNRREREACHPMYRYATLLTGWGPCLESFYETHKTAGRAAFEMACSFMQAIYDEFVYAPGATDIHTAAETAMAQGKGVCQDYTHIFLALCRKAGIPARYVAGMMIGEGATHAWAELYLDGVWRGFDPTHNRFVDDVYIKLAHGRDYRDCILERGTFWGNAIQKQKIYVSVEDIT